MRHSYLLTSTDAACSLAWPVGLKTRENVAIDDAVTAFTAFTSLRLTTHYSPYHITIDDGHITALTSLPLTTHYSPYHITIDDGHITALTTLPLTTHYSHYHITIDDGHITALTSLPLTTDTLQPSPHYR